HPGRLARSNTSGGILPGGRLFGVALLGSRGWFPLLDVQRTARGLCPGGGARTGHDGDAPGRRAVGGFSPDSSDPARGAARTGGPSAVASRSFPWRHRKPGRGLVLRLLCLALRRLGPVFQDGESRLGRSARLFWTLLAAHLSRPLALAARAADRS